MVPIKIILNHKNKHQTRNEFPAVFPPYLHQITNKSIFFTYSAFKYQNAITYFENLHINGQDRRRSMLSNARNAFVTSFAFHTKINTTTQTLRNTRMDIHRTGQHLITSAKYKYYLYDISLLLAVIFLCDPCLVYPCDFGLVRLFCMNIPCFLYRTAII